MTAGAPVGPPPAERPAAGRPRPAYYPRRERAWACGIRVLDLAASVGLRLEVTGLEHVPGTGGALLAANHVSFVDPVVMLVVGHRAGRQVRAMAVREAGERWGTGWWVRASGAIAVDEGPARLTALRAARELLAAGELVLIYPEGTIPGQDEMRAAQGGAGMLALSAGVPVLPVASAGLERGALSSRRPARVAVGPPVDLAGLPPGRGRERYLAASGRVLAEVRRLRAGLLP